MRTTWKELISSHFKETGDTWNDVEAMTLAEADLDVTFDSGYGGSQGKPFSLWTTRRMYFPVVYDGAEWVGSAPRNPCDEASCHHGGE